MFKRYFQHHRVQMLLWSVTFVILLGTGVFMMLESWSFDEAFFYTVATVTTVGYGDLVPVTEAGRIVAAFYMLLVIPFILIAIGVVSDAVFDMRNIQHKHPKKK